MAMKPENPDFTYYYLGLPGNPKLLARSSTIPWEGIPIVDTPGGHEGPRGQAAKLAFVITHHPLRGKLDNGLRDNIRHVLATMQPCRWISVDYLRIGYNEVEQNNPVVILVTAEEDQVPRAEAERVVGAISSECRRADLPDVEVEVKEGRRAELAGGLPSDEPLIHPIDYPLVGASIAIAQKHTTVLGGCGTLGGYVLIDGKVMGLTNHHVAFGSSRLEAFPTQDEAPAGVSYTILQPAGKDIETKASLLKHHIKILEKDLARALVSTTRNPASYQQRISDVKRELQSLMEWTPEKSTLGKRWRSSGIRIRNGAKDRRFRLDWP
ncbi:uncharacterized protein BP5553_09437 [Venustampulla echinocandica]|uniref:Uncharacterized protein n=1 Tax=Venustampulla echinocandica TaxID=2656787 RepID=A0A370TCS5_9HELO|nr:uncharacterized protein BP5553_09437 [Venustampulla echinocandica]RDL32035.1 hypothetical protein BP5553_09437 [Venustampulla echinocandica]